MRKKFEINIDLWNDVIGGKSNNAIGDHEIMQKAVDDELVVLDHDGNRFRPTLRADNSWELKPSSSMEITFQEWMTYAGAGMHGTTRYSELHKAAEERKIVVIQNGKRLIPIPYGDNWKLEPEKND
jgi:hypothetical protein